MLRDDTSSQLTGKMAEDLADEIVRASRGMRTMQIAIMKKRLDHAHRDYFVSGAEEGQIRRFSNFSDANNYLNAQGFNRILDGEEEEYWKNRFFSMLSSASRNIEVGVIIYSRDVPVTM